MADNYRVAMRYANDVLSGRVPACIYVKQAAQRFKTDLDKDSKFYYDHINVDAVIKLLNSLDLTEQEGKAKKFMLEAWQTFIIANVYGIKRKDNHRRKYRLAYIELPRKNGKSQMVVGMAFYHLLFDVDAQVIVSANSKDQAKNVDFKKANQFSKMLDPEKKHLIPRYSSIKFGDSNELIVTASDPTKLDGLNVSFGIIDELHEAVNGQMYNVIKSSQGSRKEPLLVVITTAGFNTESFCYQQRTYCADILSNVVTDDSQFAIIYTLDPDDDYLDQSTWKKANPNLNVSLISDFLESEVQKAVNNSAEKAGVLVKNFNKWLKSNSLEDWIPDVYVNQAMRKGISRFDTLFFEQECIVGIDLASTSDLVAVNYLFQIDGVLYFFVDHYLPEDSVNSHANLLSFKEAAANGELFITPGNVCDYDYILKDLIKTSEHSFIKIIKYDKFNSSQFIIDATEEGYKCEPFSQLPGNLNKPLKEFERLIKQDDKIVIQYNTITKWNFNNVKLVIDNKGNYSLDKSSRYKKIDGVAAMMNSLGGLLENPIRSFEIV